MKTITTEELKKKLDNNDDFVLVHVLSRENYDAKHIPQAVNIPVDELEESAPEDLPDKNKEIIVYCASKECQASPAAAKKLIALGYTNVVDYEDGVAGWQEAGNEFKGSAA